VVDIDDAQNIIGNRTGISKCRHVQMMIKAGDDGYCGSPER
jgi:hypothetical protein